MADDQTDEMDSYTQASKYAYYNIKNNKYYFTFEARGYPEREEFGHLGFIQPYFTEVNPNRPLGRPLNHSQDPASLLPIPTLLSADCLDEGQYPWNILCSGLDSWDWDYQRHSLYEGFNAAAYKTQRSAITVYQDPSATQSAMSTVTGTALQTSYPPILPKSFDANQPPTIRLFPLSNYTFGTKEHQPEEDPSVLARLKRLEEHYDSHGMRRTCEGILVCHEHNHPHILMLQIANAFFKLPGDYLHADEDEIEGFKSRLNERLAPSGTQFSGEGVNDEWQIADTLAQWWRPNFETFMYPFLPPHVTRPKECKKLYFIQLPKSKVLSVPKNMKLLAVPLFELYDNTARYGPQLSAIPHLLSRYNFEFVDEDGNVVAQTPGGDPGPQSVKVLAKGEDFDQMMNGDIKEESGVNGYGEGADQDVAAAVPTKEE
ncbi:MAG: hypothetical protein ALECFALPRED_010362 [Alectoria fallacina]|uniref:Cleavage and polyadenylation specificity factor subunit 5 n=1 Tax=Alectoria fallacina TaxID=1903189 RepID=A0A8H3PJM8_9LECA|nr:MAG: hypothetical protein ALECFALPRED_010362 [Alectoria fallacina]